MFSPLSPPRPPLQAAHLYYTRRVIRGNKSTKPLGPCCWVDLVTIRHRGRVVVRRGAATDNGRLRGALSHKIPPAHTPHLSPPQLHPLPVALAHLDLPQCPPSPKRRVILRRRMQRQHKLVPYLSRWVRTPCHGRGRSTSFTLLPNRGGRYTPSFPGVVPNQRGKAIETYRLP